MISLLFNTIVYNPLYNGLVFLVGFVPTHDVGIAVVLLTIVVRIVLYPLSLRVIKAQRDMRKIAPEITIIRDQHKGDKTAETKAIFDLYKERDIHPFSSFLLTLVQLPILIALYWVFSSGGLPLIHIERLYSFVHAPTMVNMNFLGIFNMATQHNIPLALLAGVTQFIYTRLSMGPRGIKTATEASFSDDMAKSMDVQARFVLPVIIGVFGYSFAAAVPLYYATSNSCMILLEYLADWHKKDSNKARV